MSRERYCKAYCAVFLAVITAVPCPASPRRRASDSSSGKAAGAASEKTETEPQHLFTVPGGSILRVSITAPFKTSTLQPGQVLKGKILKRVYAGDQEVIPDGTPVELVVDKIEKHKTGFKGTMSRVDSVRTLSGNRNFSDEVSFRSATLAIPGESRVPLNVSFVQGGYIVRLHSHKSDVELGGTSKMEIMGLVPIAGNVTTAIKGKNQWQQYRHPVLTLRLQKPARVMVRGDLAPGPVPFSGELASGTHARLLLLTPLGSEASHENDKFTMRVLEPIEQDGQAVIPEGSVLQGHVSSIERPRRMSRPGAVHLIFDKVYLGRSSAPILAASLKAPDAGPDAAASGAPQATGKRALRKTVYDKGAAMVDSEAGSDAMDVASYFTPPLASTGVGMAMYLGRHGREVSLPRFSEIEVIFNAPVKIAAQH